YGNAAGEYGNAASAYGNAAGAYGAEVGLTGAGAGAVDPTQFSKSAVEQYMSPYTSNVVNATQSQFNNQNAVQGNSLIGQAIASGNAFGGDRAGVAAGNLANQQQMAQAPVIAGLENQGYAQAL